MKDPGMSVTSVSNLNIKKNLKNIPIFDDFNFYFVTLN